MKIIIIGGGFAGCCAGRLLQGAGHDVTILEKDDMLGGMSRSFYLNGLTYEFGPHIIANHWSSVKTMQFIKKHIDLIETTLEAASFVEGKYTNYPPHINNIFFLKQKEQIIKELYQLNPSKPNQTNFETYVISKIGKVLYEIYFKNFTEKFWKTDPRELTAEWAKMRKIGNGFTYNKLLFNKGYYPKSDFNKLFKNLTKREDLQNIFFGEQ